ncbi:MAG: Maf family protein [Proteobacteria bacterium]|nr:Maf family protein [Pseudomonadota bacterium]
MRVLLASSSPRRRQLLSILLSDFDCCSPDIDETERDDELPNRYVERLAVAKATHASAANTLVIAADTCIGLDGVILGKPATREHARTMLLSLSGRWHQVYTGLALLSPKKRHSCVIKTEVLFADLSPSLVESYLETGEADDKAGAYGIQGAGGSFVDSIRGSYSSVVGLPLSQTRSALEDWGVAINLRVPPSAD